MGDAVAFSPDGRRLASGSWDRTVKFWEVSTGEQLSTVAGKMKEIQALAFSRDGHLLATENSSNTTALRDSDTGQEIRVARDATSPWAHWAATGFIRSHSVPMAGGWLPE